MEINKIIFLLSPQQPANPYTLFSHTYKYANTIKNYLFVEKCGYMYYSLLLTENT